VVYSGKPVASGKTHYRKVRYWDSAGNASPYRAVAQFEMGSLIQEALDDFQGWVNSNR
jgi:hypothetical protein